MKIDAPKPLSRSARLVEFLDKPLVGLSLVSIILYLIRLRMVFPGSELIGSYRIIASTIDLIFVADLVLKVYSSRMRYLRSPWFLLDLLSSLPVLNFLSLEFPELDALRVLRILRLVRLLRVMRQITALRTIPALSNWLNSDKKNDGARKMVAVMNFAVVASAAVLMLLIFEVFRTERAEYVSELQARARGGISSATLQELGGTVTMPDHDYLTVPMIVDGLARIIYFDPRVPDLRADRFEFFLVIGTMLASGLLLYVASSHLQEVSLGQLRALLNIALPAQVARHFLENPDAYSEKHRGPATILFMDFVGFTSTCERIEDLDDLSSHLEGALDQVVAELSKRDLIIDKFIGDAVMSFRGGPLVEGDACEHAYRVVRAAVDAAAVMATLNNPYFRKMKIGGASADDCMIGAFGTSTRLSYTALGNGVNLAARLEPASGQCRTRNLFCQLTYERCQGRDDLAWRRWGQLRVAGKAQAIQAFEAFDRQEVGDAAFLASFDHALELFELQQFATARQLFAVADQQRSGSDPPSQYYIERCDELLEEEPTPDWAPVLVTHK